MGCVMGILIVSTVLTVLRRGVLDVWTVLIWGISVERHDNLDNIG